MISARYITSNEIDVSSEDRKKDLDSAFITALNTEIDGKQFKRNETFKQITIDIKNNSLPVSNRFAAYKDLLSFTSLEQGK
jgi:hypothetical protein